MEQFRKTHYSITMPVVKRARAWRLYTEDGKRLVDLWQQGGRAVMGNTPHNVLKVMKDTADKGLLGNFAVPGGGRLEKTLLSLFPDYSFRFYADRRGLERSLAHANTDWSGDGFPDPAAWDIRVSDASEQARRPVLWRPFIGRRSSVRDGQFIFVIVPPLPLPGCPHILAVPPLADAESFAPSDVISPVMLAGLNRAFADVIAAKDTRKHGGLSRRLELAMKRSIWRRRGIYFHLRRPSEGDFYEMIWNKYLEKGFLLPPDWETPAIFPGELSPNEESALLALIEGPRAHLS
jgi:hypothetical protein